MYDELNGKTGMLRQLVSDVAYARVEVDSLKSDHSELRDELRTELSRVNKQLKAQGNELRKIRIWAAAAALLVPTSIGTTVAVLAYMLSKVPPEAWAHLAK